MNKENYEMYIRNLTLRDVLIYGLSSHAKVCCEWIAEHFPDTKIAGFIPDTSTDKTFFCDRPILSFDQVKHTPETAILYAERDICEVESLIKKYGLKNTFFIFYYAKPYFDTRDISYPESEIRRLYQAGDTETQQYLDNLFLAKSYGWCMLLPAESAGWVARYNKRYWDKADNDLSLYNEMTLLDCGAFTGDSLEDFHKQYGNKLRYAYALEADKTKQSALQNTVSTLGMENKANILILGVSDEAGDYFVENAGTTSGRVVLTGEQETQTIRIDDLNIEPIGKLCIKMDIEGLEMPALKGSAETIKKLKPEMAICIYHQTADIFEIPTYIKSLCPDYKFTIRGGVHSVCYCSTERF